ncbi:lactate utilization protein C [Bacillus manliponensis]|uniref:Lactate utilization protein C n=1 Tax=Bacillus manliponensis TaxID=574376 RepID=A0A073K3W9_9BACI|nr:lactate utilization protein C [Bacillus manliponensis]KEK21291.1 lactate utilization protein C [Bacillus manliponensis]
MGIQNREAFLGHIAKQLGRERPNSVEKPSWTISPQWSVFEGLTKDELVLKLIEHCEIIHTEVKRTTQEQLTETLQSCMTEWNTKSVVYANDKRFDEHKLSEFLENGELSCKRWESEKLEEMIEFARHADVGITFSDMTLAESGTVVLFNDGEKGRHVSLLPEANIAIVPKSTLVPRLTQATKAIHEQNVKGAKLPSCVNFVSGPSNSADIEMNLVVGVHGPIKTAYIIVDDL